MNRGIRIIPVIDLLAGRVVRGVGGRRDEYRPIVSSLASSSLPVDVAQGFRDRHGLTELYVADLDAIAGGSPCWSVFGALHRQGFRLWVDAGVKDVAEARPLLDAGLATLVAGLETLRGPAALERLLRLVGPERLVFSLDLQNGRPLGDTTAWPAPDPWAIAAAAVSVGLRRLLVLDLASVGSSKGPSTVEFCQRWLEQFPAIEVATGGGIRHRRDLEILQAIGVEAALVASALHDGTLEP